MKTLILAAAAGLFALGGAASADPLAGRIGPAVNTGAHAAVTTAARSGAACALRHHAGRLEAFAAPRNAHAWSLSVHGQGMRAEQEGPLYGQSRSMTRLSQMILIDPTPAPRRGLSTLENARPHGPLTASLEVVDARGRVVCSDALFVRPGPVGRPDSRPF